MNPMSMGVLFRPCEFREEFARNAEAVDGGRHAGVDRHLQQNFADLITRDAVGQRTSQMGAQFMRTVQDRNHGDVEHAAGLARQLLATPHGSPAIFVQKILQRLVETVDVLQRIADIGLAQHRLADFQALVVHRPRPAPPCGLPGPCRAFSGP
jgi:hypothetical protein